MPLLVTHTTAADGTFSSAGATAWNATHAIAGTLDLATETTGSLDLLTRSTGSLDLATRTTGSLDLTTRSTGTINLLTQTSGATATQLMYGGASGQVAQSANMVYDTASSLLTVKNKLQVLNSFGNGYEINDQGITKAGIRIPVALTGWRGTSGAYSGGDVDLRGANGSVSGEGGSVLMTAGFAAGSGPGRSGGNIVAAAGSGSVTDTAGYGGYVQFQGGDSYGAGGQAGYINFSAGNSSTSGGTAGGLAFNAGSCTTSGTPGNLDFLVGGVSGASTAVGSISFGSALGDPIAVTAGIGTTHAADLPVIVDGTQYYIRLYS